MSVTDAIVTVEQFLQANFIGPPVLVERTNTESHNELPPVYQFSTHFLDAIKILRKQGSKLEDYWWLLRSLRLHQAVLPDLSTDIQQEMIQIIDRIHTDDQAIQQLSLSEKILLHLESAVACLTYFLLGRSKEFLGKAFELAKLDISLTGSLGVRTKFQQKPVAQLLLDTRSAGDRFCGEEEVYSSSSLQDVLLEDETLLEKVKYQNGETQSQNNLSPIEQCLIYVSLLYTQRAQTHDELLLEHCTAYIDALLQQRDQIPHSLKFAVLLERCRLEKESSKRVERALKQLEVLRAAYLSDAPSFESRAKYAFATRLQPRWQVELLQADVLQSLGCLREALPIYEALERWEDVVSCYRAMRKLESAEALIRERIAIRETPALLTALGDITNDVSFYDRAWELSKHRYSHARRNLGLLLLERKTYAAALEAFKEATRAAPFQRQSIFNLGYCAMQLERWDVGASAYRRCTEIEPDSFDAWNNLAACLLHMEQPVRALAMLREALKWNYDHWRLWDNLLRVAVDCKESDTAMQAAERLLDLRGSSWNEPALFYSLVENCTETDLTEHAQKRLLTLCGRCTSTHPAEPVIWAAYALACRPESDDVERWEKYIRCLNKSIATSLQRVKGLTTNRGAVVEILNRCLLYTDEYQRFHSVCSVESDSLPSSLKQVLASARMSIKSFLTLIRREFSTEFIQKQDDDVSKLYARLDVAFSSL